MSAAMIVITTAAASAAAKNNDKFCVTSDGKTCQQVQQKICNTLDGKTCAKDSSLLNDGITAAFLLIVVLVILAILEFKIR